MNSFLKSIFVQIIFAHLVNCQANPHSFSEYRHVLVVSFDILAYKVSKIISDSKIRNGL
jgi:hypothetical protein